MFEWFLKLLGIEEDKPASSMNTFMGNTVAKPAQEKQPEPEVKAEPEPEAKAKPEPEAKAKPEPEAKAKPEPEAKAEPEPEAKAEPEPEAKAKPEPEVKAKPEPEVKAKPEPEVKAEPEPEAEPAGKSLEDEFSGLKTNYIKVLTEAGFTTKAVIDQASDKELLALKGIGQATLKVLRK